RTTRHDDGQSGRFLHAANAGLESGVGDRAGVAGVIRRPHRGADARAARRDGCVVTPATTSFTPPSGRLRATLRRGGAAIAWCAYLFLLLPSVIVIPVSFGGAQELEFPPKSFSLRLFRQFFTEPSWWGAA